MNLLLLKLGKQAAGEVSSYDSNDTSDVEDCDGQCEHRGISGFRLGQKCPAILDTCFKYTTARVLFDLLRSQLATLNEITCEESSLEA